jgi:hypothetical protein
LKKLKFIGHDEISKRRTARAGNSSGKEDEWLRAVRDAIQTEKLREDSKVDQDIKKAKGVPARARSLESKPYDEKEADNSLRHLTSIAEQQETSIPQQTETATTFVEKRQPTTIVGQCPPAAIVEEYQPETIVEHHELVKLMISSDLDTTTSTAPSSDNEEDLVELLDGEETLLEEYTLDDGDTLGDGEETLESEETDGGGDESYDGTFLTVNDYDDFYFLHPYGYESMRAGGGRPLESEDEDIETTDDSGGCSCSKQKVLVASRGICGEAFNGELMDDISDAVDDFTYLLGCAKEKDAEETIQERRQRIQRTFSA